MSTVTIANKRHYVVEKDGKTNYLPSVTTIIGSMSDKSWLEEWRNNIGDEKADAICHFAVSRGTCMHKYLEDYLDRLDIEPTQRLKETLRATYDWAISEGFTEDQIKVGRNLFYNFYHDKTFDRIKKVLIQESMLWSLIGGGYAGRVDLIIENRDGNVVIVDFKTSKKPKAKEDIEGYRLQISAYYVAYYQLFGVEPIQCEIWISNELFPEPQIIILKRAEIRECFKKFTEWVKEYHKLYDNEVKDFLALQSQNI